MPTLFDELPDAGATDPIFLECFAGDAVFTMSVMLHGLPCAKPVDVRYGPQCDVTIDGDRWVTAAKSGSIKHGHFGTPCQSMTFARDPQLRDAKHPWGLPDLMPHQEELVRLGNALAVFTANMCLCLWSAGSTFSIENPSHSWLWVLQPMRIIQALPGVQLLQVRFADFLVPFAKPTVFLHNVALWHKLRQSVFPWPGKLTVLRGQVSYRGQSVFRTHLAQTYPPLLCMRLASLLRDSWLMPSGASPGSGSELPAEVREAQAFTDVVPSMSPFLVPYGLGAPLGLSPELHVEFARQVRHPSLEPSVFSEPLEEALKFEISHSAQDIDDFRGTVLRRVVHLAASLTGEQKCWAQEAPEQIRPLVSLIHGPLWQALLAELPVESHGFLRSLQQGFPMVGRLPPCEGGAVPAHFQESGSIQQLRDQREVMNRRVLHLLKEVPFSDDIGPQVQKDHMLGAMTLPRPLREDDLEQITLTRRIPVRELRASGWRTRIVDHYTECGVNWCTTPQDRVKHDTLDSLAQVVLQFFDESCDVRLWKRDVSQAFRRVPVAPEHLEFMWGVWVHDGTVWVAQHQGSPFGTVAAVYAWHRVGFFLLLIVLVLFRAPGNRYVDDFFGASKRGVRLTGGVILSILASILGFPCDESKDADYAEAMTVLGCLCTVCFTERVLYTRVATDKASRYRLQLAEMLDLQHLSPGDASKLAGRLCFAVTVSGCRVGRAYIKPFYAQAHAPTPANTISPRLLQSATWFMAYLERCPFSVRRSRRTDTPQCVTWSDAAGATRWVAAIVSVHGQYFWTRLKTPEAIWEQLLDRGDFQIGFQELLGLLLAWGTFGHLLARTCWVAFVDNDGVLHAVMKGGGGGPESFACIGHLWLDLAAAQVDLHVGRVESAANPADGPTRDSLEVLQRMKATWMQPRLPSWVQHFWSMPML